MLLKLTKRNEQLLVSVIIGLALVGGGVYLYMRSQEPDLILKSDKKRIVIGNDKQAYEIVLAGSNLTANSHPILTTKKPDPSTCPSGFGVYGPFMGPGGKEAFNCNKVLPASSKNLETLIKEIQAFLKEGSLKIIECDNKYAPGMCPSTSKVLFESKFPHDMTTYTIMGVMGVLLVAALAYFLLRK